jgi:predicted TPR repeat methyltransferase
MKKTSSSPNIFQMGKAAPARQPGAVEIQTGVALFQQGRLPEAEQYALMLTRQYPTHGFGWKMLGLVIQRQGRLQDALAPMQTAAKLLPQDHEAFNNLAGNFQQLGHSENAIVCYRHALALQPEFLPALNNLAELHVALGQHEEALPLFERRLALNPDDGYAAHQVAMRRGENTERAPSDYVAQTFDNYADKFDSHLQDTLQYKTPSDLAALVFDSGHAPAGKLRVMDLGCGTGLVGEAVAPHAGEIVGVDISSRMLEKARAKQVYQLLVCGEIVPVMQAELPASFDLLISADVFIYIGKLDDIAKEGRRLLRSGGLMAFSVEDIEPTMLKDGGQSAEPDYQLKKSGRYGQSLGYLDRLASTHGFQQIACKPAVIRMESDVPVMGHLILWQA